MSPTIRCRSRLLAAALLIACAPLAAADEQTVAKAADKAEAEAVASGEPSREDLRDAYSRRIASVNDGAVRVLGKTDAARVDLVLEDLQKLVCRPLDRAGVQYNCRVEVRTRIADRRPKTAIVQLWISRDGEEWVVR